MDYASDNSSIEFEFNELESLCDTCRYIEKCPRFKVIRQKLDDMESQSLGDWRLDVNLFSIVNKCDLFEGIDDIDIWINGGGNFEHR